MRARCKERERERERRDVEYQGDYMHMYSCANVFNYDDLEKVVPGLRDFDLVRKKYVVSIGLCMRYEEIDFQ